MDNSFPAKPQITQCITWLQVAPLSVDLDFFIPSQNTILQLQFCFQLHPSLIFTVHRRASSLSCNHHEKLQSPKKAVWTAVNDERCWWLVLDTRFVSPDPKIAHGQEGQRIPLCKRWSCLPCKTSSQLQKVVPVLHACRNDGWWIYFLQRRTGADL